MERRSHRRAGMHVTLTCRIPATPSRVLIVDISQSGCRIRSPLHSCILGTTVHFGTSGDIPFTGEIVWIRERLAGVRFHSPLTVEIARELGLDGDRARAQDVRMQTVHLPPEEPRENRLRQRLRSLAASR